MHPSRLAALLLSTVMLGAACSASDSPAVVEPGEDDVGSSSGTSGAGSSGASSSGTGGSSSGEVDSGPPAPTPTDGIKNGDETGADCGGATAPRCLPGLSCLAATDCAEKVCTTGLCSEPTHIDGVKNGDETGVDCGGDAPATCAPGQGCADAEDCTEKVCLQEVCANPTAIDEVKNGDETDVDCGGTSGRLCAVTKACLAGGDCAEKVCGADLKCSAPTFTDLVRNGNETGTDCGGPDANDAQRCAAGQGCVVAQGARDCQSKVCQNQLCQAPTFTDLVQNGNETGVDCGGPTAPNRCPAGQGCAAGTDCTEKVCGPANNRVCLAPTFADGVKNGTETDLDCGGPAATATQRCAAGLLCGGDTDCSSDGCAYNGRCAMARSCKPMLGGATCGGGEVVVANGVATPGAAHESCCTSIPVPGQNIRLDKYEITAGRMREFLRRVPNVRTWVNTNAVPQLSNMNNFDLRVYLSDGVNEAYHPRRHVGPSVFQSSEPSISQGCYLGAPGTGGYGGHNTYWFDAADQAAIGGAAARMFTQDQLDTKSLTCTTYVILAAFCAWDGGFLPSAAQTRAAWGNVYPWGDGNQRYDNATVLANGQTRANWNSSLSNTFAVAYKYPLTNPGFDYGQYDQAFVVASPGRMLNDVATAGGWRDLAANVFEITTEYRGTYNDAARGVMPRVTWLGGSFEGHYGARDDGGYQYSVLTKYGKTGGRCARPL